MRKILQLIVIIFTLSTIGFAQDYEPQVINMGTNFDSREYISFVIYGDENFLYAITSSNGFIANTDNEHYFVRIDLKAKKSTVLATIGGKENYFDNNSRFGFEQAGVVYFFYSELNFETKENELFVYSYDIKSEKLIEKNKKVSSFSFKDGGKKNNGTYDFYINEPANTFSIVGFYPCPNAIVPTLITEVPVVNKLDVWTFKNGLENPTVSNIVLESDAGYQCDDFIITEDNTFYGFFGKVTKTAYLAFPEITYLVKFKNGKLEQKQIHKNDDLRLRDGSLLKLNDKVVIAGTYLYHDNKNLETGLFTVIVDESDNFKENLFPFWSMKNMDQLYHEKLISEKKEIKFTVKNKEIIQTGTNEFCLVINRSTYNGETEGVVEGTIISNFNADGSIKWQRIIPNSYADLKANLAFKVENTEENILLFFNDKESKSEVSSLTKDGYDSNSFIKFGYYIFDKETGEASRKSIYENRLTCNNKLIYTNSNFFIATRIFSKEEKLIILLKKK